MLLGVRLELEGAFARTLGWQQAVLRCDFGEATLTAEVRVRAKNGVGWSLAEPAQISCRTAERPHKPRQLQCVEAGSPAVSKLSVFRALFAYATRRGILFFQVAL